MISKKHCASDHCFGGTKIWRIDLSSGSGSGNNPNGGGSSNPGSPGSGGGQSYSSDGNSSAVIYVDPIIWTKSNPVIQCEPPCVLNLPLLVPPTETTDTFPPYITPLELTWSGPTGWKGQPGQQHLQYLKSRLRPLRGVYREPKRLVFNSGCFSNLGHK